MKKITALSLISTIIINLFFSVAASAESEKDYNFFNSSSEYSNSINSSKAAVNLSSAECYGFNTINDEVVYTYSPEYDMTVTVFGRDACLNSEQVIKNIIKSGILDNEKIKVIFIDCDKKAKGQVTSFAEKMGKSNISFCYDTSDKAITALGDYVKIFSSGKNATIPIISFIKGDGTLLKVTQGVLESEYIYQYAMGDFSADKIIEFTISGSENYDYAFEVLENVNNIRLSLEQDPLTMNEKLMNAAMQRAAELSIYYSHTRPNGEDALTILEEDGYSYAENIAVGQNNPYDVVASWKNSSGHYKNMTNQDFNSIGIGCFTTSDGYLCWVQLFSSADSTSVNKSGTVLAEHNIKIQKRNLNFGFSAETDIHTLTKNQYTKINVWNCNKLYPYIKQNIIGTQFNYISTNSNVITITENGYCTIKGNGVTTITTTLKTTDSFYMQSDYTVGHIYSNDLDNDCDYCGEKRTVQNNAPENNNSVLESEQTSKPSNSNQMNSNVVSSTTTETSKPSNSNQTNNSSTSSKNNVVSSKATEASKPLNSNQTNNGSTNSKNNVVSSATTATSKPKTDTNSNTTQQEQTVAKKDKPLTTIDYLAFSWLAYFDCEIGQTVENITSSNKNDIFNKEIIESLKKIVPQTELDLYAITYEMLCENVLNWKVIANSKTWQKSKDAGFYAVTFYSESLKQAVIAYRGSTGFSKITTEDGYNDWLENDLPFHLFNKYTGQLQNAKDYYQYSRNLDTLSSANITATGHSLGGALGQTVSMTYGVYAEVFNAASVFEALYINTLDEMSLSFAGVDKWNFVSHVNNADLIGTYQNKYKNLPYIVHKDYYTTLLGTSVEDFFFVFTHPHSLQSMIWRDTSTGDIRMSSDSKVSIPKGFSIGKKNPIMLGTSVDDTLIFVDVNKFYIKDVRICGGDGNDLLQSIGSTDDLFVGGTSNEGDTIIGGLGNDTYIYNKGDGVQWIYDVGGYDTVKLLGLDKADVVTASRVCKIDGNNYKEITLNGNPILYISLNRSKNDSFKINKEDNTLFSFTGNWNKFYSAYVACPVDVDILDADGNIIMTIQDKSTITEHTEYGNFYAFEDENGEYCKHFDLAEGYSAKIRGVDEGAMDVAILYDSSNPAMDSVGVENVPITKSTTAIFKLNHETQAVLCVEDGTKQTDFLLQKQKTITFDAGEGSCDVSTIKTDFAGIVIELPIPERDEHEFKGWKTSEGNLISVGDMLNSDITLYADWGDKDEYAPVVTSNTSSRNKKVIIISVAGVMCIAIVVSVIVIVKKRKAKKREHQGDSNT